MAENSKIEWTTHTFNPWRGCEHAALPNGSTHPACAHCYAEALSKRNPAALGQWGAGGTRIKAADKAWQEVATWNKEAACLRTFDCNAGAHSDACPQSNRPRVFCASLADVFEDWHGPIHDHRGQVLMYSVKGCGSGKVYVKGCGYDRPEDRPLTMDDLRRDLFALIDDTPNLDWLLLTKRPQNIRRMLSPYSYHACVTGDCPHERQSDCDAADKLYRDNVWLGTSVSDQATADALVPELLKCRDLAPVLFLSVEPLLGPINLRQHFAHSIRCSSYRGGEIGFDESVPCNCGRPRIDWVIIGGESGHHARPCDIQWIRDIRDQCQAAGVPVFIKQDSGVRSGMQGRICDELWRVKEFPSAI